MSENMNCPCCGAIPGQAHDDDCALVAFIQSTRATAHIIDSQGRAVPVPGMAPDKIVPVEPAEELKFVTTGLDVSADRMSTTLPDHGAPRIDAPALLDIAAGHMRDRAATYDQPGGERSMGRTVEAFNIITGREGCDELVGRALQMVREHLHWMHTTIFSPAAGLQTVKRLEGLAQMLDASLSQGKARSITESEGWLLMQILKDVRDRQREKPHRDSLEDGIAYSALKAEARLAE